jgi:hypothetical protein
VLLIRASHLIFARMRAAIDRLDQGADFGEGHELDEATAARVPAKMVGCMLTPAEAGKLLRRIEAMPRSRRRRKNALSAFANCGQAVAYALGSVVPTADIVVLFRHPENRGA